MWLTFELVGVGEVEPVAAVDDGQAECVGERDQLRDGTGVTAREVDDQDRESGGEQSPGQVVEVGAVQRGEPGGLGGSRGQQPYAVLERLLLHVEVERHEHRRLHRRVHQLEGAVEGLDGGPLADGLVAPLHVVLDDGLDVLRGVDPVDPRAALAGVDGAGAAEYEQRYAVAPGVEDGHRGVQQTDVGVHEHTHVPAARLVVAVRHGHGDLLVAGHDDLGGDLGVVRVDEGVVHATEGRAGVEGDLVDALLVQELHHQVGEVGRRHACSLVWGAGAGRGRRTCRPRCGAARPRVRRVR